MCHVSTVNAQLRFRIMGHFSKISLLIRFGAMEKKFREEEKSSSTVGLFEVICLCFISEAVYCLNATKLKTSSLILENVSSSRSCSPEKRRLMHNRSRSVQRYRSFNQHLKGFILDDV